MKSALIVHTPLYDLAVAYVRERGECGVSMLQRQFGIGYAKVACLIDAMEEAGVVSGITNGEPRKVLK
jgi:S-DNA-T family DNA segregation ATPase FtsK/SpoIIIE